MARPKAAQRAAADNVAPSLTQRLSPARAEASRRNGARSQGPVTTEGKARASRNALKHGLCADRHLVGTEDAQDYEALEAALFGELAPVGIVQAMLVRRIVRAAWRLERAERIEAELFAFRMYDDADLGLALTRDCNSARAFDSLQRYRGSAHAEFFRALRTLKALQAEAAQEAPLPNQPKARTIAGESRAEAAPALPVRATPPSANVAPALPAPAAPARAAAPGRRAASSDIPIEPEGRGNPGETTPRPGCRAHARENRRVMT